MLHPRDLPVTAELLLSPVLCERVPVFCWKISLMLTVRSLFIFTKLLLALGVPKAIPRFRDSLGELLTGLYIESYS